MALKSERSRIRFKEIESVPSYDAVHRTGLSASFPEPPANEERGMSSQTLSVGEELRRARTQASLDLADVAAHLRIRSNFLSALEEGRPDALPGITYAIGYVRTYAGFLGLDPESAVRRFKEEAAGLNSKTQLVFPSPAPEGRVPGFMLMLVAAMLAGSAFGGWYWLTERDGDLLGLVPAVPERLAQLIEGDAPPAAGVPAGNTASTLTAAPAGPPDAPATGSYSDANPAGVAVPAPPRASSPAAAPPAVASAPPTTPDRTPATAHPAGSPAHAPAAAIAPPLAAAPAGGVPATSVADASATAPDVGDTPDETAPPEATAAAGGQSVPAAPPIAPVVRPAEAGPEVPAAPRIAGLIGASEAAVPSGRTAAGPIERVMIRATGDSWVQVRDAQGTALFTRVLREGDIYRVPDQSGLRLATGNAGALEILVDGAAAPSLGGFGEVVRNVLLDPARLAAGSASGTGPATPR